MIPQEYRDFGIVEIPRDGFCFRVWSSPSTFADVQTAQRILDVRWSGTAIVATFETHKRVYYGLGSSQYEILYS